jgi:hypothetical protein
MIVGFPYQTPEIIEEELSGLLALKPTLTQFLIYGPCPGTPFYEKVVRDGLLNPDVAADPELFYHRGTGFHSLVQHPTMTTAQIEAEQVRCFREDFRRLGPAIYRSIERWFLGYLKLRDSSSAVLKAKAERFAREIRKTYPVFLAGRIFGPTAEVRRWISDLAERIYAVLGRPRIHERLLSFAAAGAAAWTGLTLKLNWFQHPSLVRHTFRMPGEGLAKAWRRLDTRADEHHVRVERRAPSTVWIRIEGKLAPAGAGKLVAGLRDALHRKRERVVLDLAHLAQLEVEAERRLAEGLRAYRDRIRVVLPRMAEFATLAALFSLYR